MGKGCMASPECLHVYFDISWDSLLPIAWSLGEVESKRGALHEECTFPSMQIFMAEDKLGVKGGFCNTRKVAHLGRHHVDS